MKRYMAVFTYSPDTFEKSGWSKLDEATRKQREQAGIKAWGDWVAANRGAILELGGPLGRTKRTSAAGVEDVRNNLSGFTIIQAESQEAAARLFLEHPHFTLFPGDAVEVMEILPIPGQ